MVVAIAPIYRVLRGGCAKLGATRYSQTSSEGMRMRLTAPQMALMSRLLDEALPLDDAGRRRWLEALGPEYADLLPALRPALLPEFYPPDSRSFHTLLESGINNERAGPASTGLQPGAKVGPYELIRLLGA